MRQINVQNKLAIPAIGVGCMRIAKMDRKDLECFIRSSLDAGGNFFDHADIYGGGECESHFARSIGMNDSLRAKMLLQTKCAIRPGVCYDFSKEHILSSVEGSLSRLKTDYIDILLLHRPDILMEPEEVAEAFAVLKKSGKVRYFGVSNHNPGQIALLNKYCAGEIIFNQLQLSVAYCPMLDAGVHVNRADDLATVRDGGVVDYCRLEDITIQAWSPFQYGSFAGVFIDSEKYPLLNSVLKRLAEKYSVTDSAIATAWILRHPAQIQAIPGTTNIRRLLDIYKAAEVVLTREEWYELYMAA
jgi:predicted oxidoreductase